MKRILALALFVLMATLPAIAQDDLRKIVDAAILIEVEEFDGLDERWKKKKLKPTESVRLFGKKTLTAKQQTERMKEVREQVLAGEVSFRVLKLSDLHTGQSGYWPQDVNRITCHHVMTPTGDFLGTYTSETVSVRVIDAKTRAMQTTRTPHISNPFLFAGIPGSAELVDQKTIAVTCPLIVTGKFVYATTQGGQVTTWRIESLANCIKRISEADRQRPKN